MVARDDGFIAYGTIAGKGDGRAAMHIFTRTWPTGNVSIISVAGEADGVIDVVEHGGTETSSGETGEVLHRGAITTMDFADDDDVLLTGDLDR